MLSIGIGLVVIFSVIAVPAEAAPNQPDQTDSDVACPMENDIRLEKTIAQLGINAREFLSLTSSDRDIACTAILAWDNSSELSALLISETATPLVNRAIATRYVSLAPTDPFGWCQLSISQSKLNSLFEARQSALNAIKYAENPDAIAGAWLAMASVEDRAGNSAGLEVAMQTAFRAKPSLRQEFEDERRSTIEMFWPGVRRPQTKSDILSDHPSIQDRIDTLRRGDR